MADVIFAVTIILGWIGIFGLIGYVTYAAVKPGKEGSK